MKADEVIGLCEVVVTENERATLSLGKRASKTAHLA